MKNIIVLLLFLTCSIIIFSKESQYLNISYENSNFQGDYLKSTNDLSLSYSQWQILENNHSPHIFIKFSYGDFESRANINENFHTSLAYEQLYDKNFNSFVTQKFLLGFSYNIFDFNYKESITYNNSEFTGDSIQALKLYLSYGLEFMINKKLGINMGFVPQLLLFKDTTERGLENNIMKTSLGIGYNLGFTYKF